MTSAEIISQPNLNTTAYERIELFNMPMDVVRFDQAVDQMIAWAQGDRSRIVITANVDHVVRFQKSAEFREMYAHADMVVADGMPVIWGSRFVGKPLPQRVAGSDLFPALASRAAAEDVSIFLLGGSPTTADRSKEIFELRHPNIRVVGTYCPEMGFEKDDAENERIVSMIRKAETDLLFVGLGSPKQEKWIVDHHQACGTKLCIGVGISFSFLCGDVDRAPRWIQRLGLEWAHRLVQEPSRLWRRYLIEDSAFVGIVLRERFKRRPRE